MLTQEQTWPGGDITIEVSRSDFARGMTALLSYRRIVSEGRIAGEWETGRQFDAPGTHTFNLVPCVFRFDVRHPTGLHSRVPNIQILADGKQQ